MPSPLSSAGGQFDSPPRYVPLHVNEWWTGLWTNRSALRDAATTYLIQKFYSGARFESLIGGANMEISPRLTPARRFGNSVYNSATFPAINTFYAFRLSNPFTFAETIRVIADSAATVYDATGPSTQATILTKASGSQQSSFQGVGNTLYIADGVDAQKWLMPGSWQANTTVTPGQLINTGTEPGYTQMALGGIALPIVGFASSGTVVTLYVNPQNVPNEFANMVGVEIAFSGFSVATYLNGNTYPIASVLSSTLGIFTINLVAASASQTADNGSGTTGTGITGSSAPTFSTTPFAITADGTEQWKCYGGAVQPWQPAPPSNAPTLVPLNGTRFWQPNYQVPTGPGPYSWFSIQDPSGNIQRAYASGKTGLNYPNFVAPQYSLTADGTVTWENLGVPGSWTPATGFGVVGEVGAILDSNGNFQGVLTPGTSGGSTPTWSTTTGDTTTDGTVTWVCLGPGNVITNASIEYAFSTHTIDGSVSTASPFVTIQGAILGPAIAPGLALIQISGSLTSTVIASGGNGGGYIKRRTFNPPGGSGIGGGGTQVDQIWIWRTTQGQSTLFFEDAIPTDGLTTSFTYNEYGIPDTSDVGGGSLNVLIEAPVAESNNPPPIGLNALTFYLGSVWGVVGGLAYYSNSPQETVGNNTNNWNPNNYIQLPSSITKLWATTTGMLFFTNKGIYLSSGIDNNGNPNQPVPLLEDIGLLSVNCFTINGSIPILFTGDKQFISLDPSSGVSRVGFPIEDILQSFSPTASYVTWHTKGPDQAAYIADGSGSWYRVCLTPAPETGSYTWSVKATIVGGMKCVQSIETSPGVQDLLLGPVSSGPILHRDSTTWQDNGEIYPASIIVGSIVLAQPGQAAQVGFVTTEELVIPGATVVSPSVLTDEISGTFETLTEQVNDPPWAVASSSVYSYRWYFSTIPNPSWMRHLQIQFTWPSENYQNELLTWSPVASLHLDSGN